MHGVPVLVAALSAFFLGMCVVPVVRELAIANGFLDNPDRHRKLHTTPVALGGGIAIWLAAAAGWATSRLVYSREFTATGDGPWFVIVVAIGSLLILALGIVDDRIGMRGRHKLVGQLLAACFLVTTGLRVDALSCFGLDLNLGIFAYPATVVWIVLVINAFNLIDGMDGFCGSLGVITSLALGFLAYRSGLVDEAMIAVALAGSLAAFLRYNLPPATIYLGDAGSMTVGLVISALSIRACSSGSRGGMLVLPVIALLALPLIDITAAVVRRLLKGRSLFAPDREHIHHCLKERLGNPTTALAVAVIITAITASIATGATMYREGDTAACFALAAAIGGLAATNTFGANESRLLLFRLRVATAPFRMRLALRHHATAQECHLRGCRDWTGIWNALVREGEASGVWRIDLAIDMVAAGEVYHGYWTSPAATLDEPRWSIVHTIHAGDSVAGMIRVSGGVDCRGTPYLDKVENLVHVVESRLLSDAHPAPAAPAAAARSFSNVDLSVNSALT
jgi:UDP-GlcNAc:undecaprenyl-phosphate GlcNAc-1-phosphate transferase